MFVHLAHFNIVLNQNIIMSNQFFWQSRQLFYWEHLFGFILYCICAFNTTKGYPKILLEEILNSFETCKSSTVRPMPLFDWQAKIYEPTRPKKILTSNLTKQRKCRWWSTCDPGVKVSVGRNFKTPYRYTSKWDVNLNCFVLLWNITSQKILM